MTGLTSTCTLQLSQRDMGGWPASGPLPTVSLFNFPPEQGPPGIDGKDGTPGTPGMKVGVGAAGETGARVRASLSSTLSSVTVTLEA